MDDLSDSDRTTLVLLCGDYERGAAIQPLDIFDMDMPTGINLLAWLATNTIILMQFKVSEAAEGANLALF